MTGLWLWRGPSWSASLRDWQADEEIIADRGERFQRHVSATLDTYAATGLLNRAPKGSLLGADRGARLDAD